MAEVNQEKQLPFTERERRIWDATYAAAFISDFDRFYGLTHDFDRALKPVTAERASYLADCAVLELRRWRAQEAPNLGEEAQ